MSETTALHVAIILGCTALAVLAIIVISVRLSRPQTGRHVRDVPADPVWGNLAEHDEAFAAEIREALYAAERGETVEREDYTRYAEDPAATDDVRSAWMQAPVRAATGGRPPWDSQQFPAVQLVPLPDFPDGADMPAAGERLAVAVSRGDGEPSNLPGLVSEGSVSATQQRESGGRNSANQAGEPVLEGRIVLAPVLGYIDGLALTDAYYERIEQIGVQARVLALAAAA